MGSSSPRTPETRGTTTFTAMVLPKTSLPGADRNRGRSVETESEVDGHPPSPAGPRTPAVPRRPDPPRFRESHARLGLACGSGIAPLVLSCLEVPPVSRTCPCPRGRGRRGDEEPVSRHASAERGRGDSERELSPGTRRRSGGPEPYAHSWA